MCRRMLMHVNVVLRVVLVSTLSCCSMKSAVQIKFLIWFTLVLTTWLSRFTGGDRPPVTRWQLPCAPTPVMPGSIRLHASVYSHSICGEADRISATLIFPFLFLNSSVWFFKHLWKRFTVKATQSALLFERRAPADVYSRLLLPQGSPLSVTKTKFPPSTWNVKFVPHKWQKVLIFLHSSDYTVHSSQAGTKGCRPSNP